VLDDPPVCCPPGDTCCASFGHKHGCPPGTFCAEIGCVPCPEGETDCDGTCTNTATDPANCGSCGHACAPGVSCVDGTCGCGNQSCPPEQCCDGVCVDLQSDPANCGSCGHACAAGETCQAGTCGCGGASCAGTCCGSTCVETLSDPANCGGCGLACPGGTFGLPETAQVCVLGQCTCPPGRTFCDGRYCADLANDDDDCGACGNGCPNNEVCVEGTAAAQPG
jgi:hypothetical protein